MAARSFGMPALALALLLSSAGFASAYVWRGNDTGGIIPWSVENERLAPEFRLGPLRRVGQIRPHHRRHPRARLFHQFHLRA